MDNSSYQGQKRADPTLALVKALRLAHDEAHDPVLWPTPEEELEERRRSKKRRGDSRDHRGGGSSGGGGGHGGSGSGKLGGGDPDHHRGGDSGGGRGGGVWGGRWLWTPPREQFRTRQPGWGKLSGRHRWT